MTQYLVFLLLGLSNGAVFAALALGLVLTFRSSGVINFATGSIALVAAYVYAYLRQGQLFSLLPGTSPTFSVGHVFGLWSAMALALLVSGIIGLLLHLLVFRPLRSAPPVARVVASLGVSVVITSSLVARLGTAGPLIKPIFPSGSWTIFGVRVSTDRFYLAATIVGIALVLTILFRYTRFGLATRAAAESEKGAYVSGFSPDAIAAGNWILSSMVAGVAGILIAPISQVGPATYTLFIVPALAAAIIGGFTRLMPAVFAGLAIGMLQSESTYLQAKFSWLPSTGMAELVPLVLVLIVLVVRAKPLPSRGATAVRALGRAPRPRDLRVTPVVFAAVGVAGLFALQGSWRSALITSLIFAVIGLSLVVVTGYAGQVSLAQLTIAGASGFLLGPLAGRAGIPFPIAPLLAALGAAAIGVIIGLPALRVRGLTLAVVTLTMAYTLSAIWFNNIDLVPGDGVKIKTPRIFGYDLGIGTGTTSFPRSRFGLLCLVTLVLVALGVARLRISRLGSQMLAVRANERSAAAAGIHVTRVKIAAFAIASFVAGIGGTLLAYRQESVIGTSYTALGGLALFTTVYLAGITSVSGGILAGFLAGGGLIFLAADSAFSAGSWYAVITALALLFTVIFNPEGLVGPFQRLIERRRSSSGLAVGVPAAHVPDGDRDRSRRVITPGPSIALEVSALTVHYGGVMAVDNVSLAVPEGLIVGLIGPNGAGKTTMIDAMSGLTRSDGRVLLHGDDLGGRRPFQRTRAGLGRTFQAIELYDDLSVSENIVVGLAAARGRPGAFHPDVLADTLRLLRLEELRDRAAGQLSQGQRQLVSIGRALAGHPKVLLLDEPAGGLDATESLWLGDRLRDIRDSGVTIVLVDHDMNLVLSLCDRIHVLDFGREIAVGTPAEIRCDKRVTAAYLGTTHAEGVTA
jgi:ABC-type branched-subunit amino acid transport system ATPase component/branched-subunit amino acid ABC-type transport system permease component